MELGKLILKCIWKRKRPRIARIIHRRVRQKTCPTNYQEYYEAIITKRVIFVQVQINGQVEWNGMG